MPPLPAVPPSLCAAGYMILPTLVQLRRYVDCFPGCVTFFLVQVSAFECVAGTQENPELIWNDESREKVSGTVSDLKGRFYESQRTDPSALWNVWLFHELLSDIIVCLFW